MRLTRLTFAVTAAALFVSAGLVGAQDDPIAARKALMKANGAAMGQLVPIAKGEKPYDEAVVTAALAKLAEDAAALDADKLFPVGSETGGETAAAPAIWSNRDGFKAEIEKFRTATSSAVASAPKDQTAVGATVGMLGQSCGSCHEGFRIKKS